jgi:hypothetical protein
MSEVLTAEKPRSTKTVLTSALVVVLIAAFAAAFYYFGGASLVSGLMASVFAPGKPSGPTPFASSAPGSSAPAAEATSSSSGLKLPAGVDEAFAKRMYVEQLESEANIQKLVGGKVAEFTMSAATTVAGGTELPIRATFKDKTPGDGILGLASKQGNWYFAFISGKRAGKTGGLADSVSNDPTEALAANSETALASKTVDNDVLNTILAEQVKNQEVLTAIAAGTFTKLKVDSVTPGQGTATLGITLTGPNNASMKGRILCISKSIDGTDTWFVTSFSKV